MTPELFTPTSREALAKLPRCARMELEAWLRNKLFVLTGTNDLEADDDRLNHQTRAYARQRSRAAEICLQELAELLGTPKEDKSNG